MMKRISRKITLTLLALVLCLTVSVGGTLAYFTDYDEAFGGHDVVLGHETELEEELKGLDKHVSVKNNGETDVVVRVRFFGEAEYMDISASDEWTEKGGWYYYREVLAPGQSTSEIVAKVTIPEKDSDKVFDIVVVHESSQVVYENGKLKAVDPDFADVEYTVKGE